MNDNKHIEAIKKSLKFLEKGTDEIKQEIKDIRKENKENLDEIKNKMNDDFVRKEEIKPIRMFVYGLIGVISIYVINQLLNSLGK